LARPNVEARTNPVRALFTELDDLEFDITATTG